MMYTMLYACLETRLLSAVMVQPCSCPSCGCGLVPTGGLGYGSIRLARRLNELNSVHMAFPKKPCRNMPYLNGLGQYEQNEQRPPFAFSSDAIHADRRDKAWLLGERQTSGGSWPPGGSGRRRVQCYSPDQAQSDYLYNATDRSRQLPESMQHIACLPGGRSLPR